MTQNLSEPNARYQLPPMDALPPIISLNALARFSHGEEFATERASFAPPANGTDAAYWGRVRSQFDIANGLTFLNNGTYSPPPRLVLETQKRWQRYLASHPYDNAPVELLERVRGRTAKFVNADIDEIVLTRTTTEGINLLVHGLDWREGDEIILDRHDHFTAFQSFLTLTGRHGVKLVFVDLGAEPGTEEQIVNKYAASITSRTRLLFINWVNYRTGWQMPVKALAALGRRHGLIVSVDAAQAFGAVPIDLADIQIDHLAAPSHKWILAGPGAGFAYFSKRIIERVWPTAGPSRVRGVPAHWQDTARKLDNHGPKNISSAMGFLEALEFHDTIGGDVFRGRLRELSTQLRTGLSKLSWGRLITPAEPERSSALTTFHVGDEHSADDIAERLFQDSNIKVNSEAFVQLNAIRISPHIFTTPVQIDRLLYELKKF